MDDRDPKSETQALRDELRLTKFAGILRAFPDRRLPAIRALAAGLIGLRDAEDARIDAVVREVDDHLAAASAVLRSGLLIVLDVGFSD